MHLLIIFCIYSMNYSAFSPFGAGYPSQKAKLSSRGQVGCLAQPPRLLGESQDDGFGWRATASGLSPSNRGGCASERLHHGLFFRVVGRASSDNGLKIRLNPSSQALGPGPGPAPRAQAQGLRRRMRHLDKRPKKS